MKKNKFLAVILCISLSVVFMSSCSSKTTEQKKIAVIVKALDSDFWHSVKNGVDAASTEYNVSVTFEGPENEEDYAAQNKLIEKAVKNKADAIVLSAIDYEKSAETVNDAVRSGVKVVTVDSSVNSDRVSMFIGTDNFAAGKKAAEAAVKCFSDDEDINIGLINYYKSTENGMQREDGFRQYLKDIKNAKIVSAVNVNSNTQSVVSAVNSLIAQHPEINVLVGFNEWMTLGIGNSVKQLNLGEKVHAIGFDTNSVSVGMLETGEIDTLIVQNPFAIGYLGIKNAADLISGEVPQKKEIYTDAVAVNKDNLFDKDIQKLVFRFK